MSGKTSDKMLGKEIDFLVNFEDDTEIEEEIEEIENNDFESFVEDIKTAYNEIKSYLNYNSISIAEKLTVEDLLDLIITYFN
jgi:hypothetical protein